MAGEIFEDGEISGIAVAAFLALELAGITPGTLDPPGGEIVRDSDGEPTGVLHEKAGS